MKTLNYLADIMNGFLLYFFISKGFTIGIIIITAGITFGLISVILKDLITHEQNEKFEN